MPEVDEKKENDTLIKGLKQSLIKRKSNKGRAFSKKEPDGGKGGQLLPDQKGPSVNELLNELKTNH